MNCSMFWPYLRHSFHYHECFVAKARPGQHIRRVGFCRWCDAVMVLEDLISF